jgi:hypothetical protein
MLAPTTSRFHKSASDGKKRRYVESKQTMEPWEGKYDLAARTRRREKKKVQFSIRVRLAKLVSQLVN